MNARTALDDIALQCADDEATDAQKIGRIEDILGSAERAEGTPTDEQALTLARLMREFNAERASLNLHPFDLPSGYVMLTLDARGADGVLVFGIAPNGDASS
jgi:hypothetical protein